MKRTFVLFLFLTACAESEGRFPVEVSTVGDDGKPFPDLLVTIGKVVAGKTDANGKLRVAVRGKEGTKVAVTVETPKGYRQLTNSPAVVLRRLTNIEGGKNHVLPVEHIVKLAPLERQYAVLIRVGVGGLPVESFGARQAVTNSRGVAMFVYRGQPGDELKVKVDTSGHPELRPQNPSETYVLGQRAEAYVLHEKFTVNKPAAPKRPKKPVHVGPVRL